MINIAICDDNIEFCNKLETYIYELYPNINNLSIDVFYDCSSIIRNLETQKYDIILLDIKFSGNISGIDVGDYIRNNICNDYTQIVYISANERYAYELFDTRPLNFLVKPVDKNKLHDVLDKAMELCNKNINVIVFKNSK
ncbi:MAG: response regulator [Clostridia bacterium]|nr:response regulator [Clostridia bacterium]